MLLEQFWHGFFRLAGRHSSWEFPLDGFQAKLWHWIQFLFLLVDGIPYTCPRVAYRSRAFQHVGATLSRTCASTLPSKRGRLPKDIDILDPRYRSGRRRPIGGTEGDDDHVTGRIGWGSLSRPPFRLLSNPQEKGKSFPFVDPVHSQVSVGRPGGLRVPVPSIGRAARNRKRAAGRVPPDEGEVFENRRWCNRCTRRWTWSNMAANCAPIRWF